MCRIIASKQWGCRHIPLERCFITVSCFTNRWHWGPVLRNIHWVSVHQNTNQNPEEDELRPGAEIHEGASRSDAHAREPRRQPEHISAAWRRDHGQSRWLPSRGCGMISEQVLEEWLRTETEILHRGCCAQQRQVIWRDCIDRGVHKTSYHLLHHEDRVCDILESWLCEHHPSCSDQVDGEVQ